MSLLAPVLEGLGIWIYPQVYPQGRTVKLLEDWLLVFFQLADVSTNNCFRSAVLLGIKSVVLTRATFNCWECQMGKSQEIAVQWRWGSWNMIYILVLICVLFYRSFGISHSYIFLCIQELYIYIVCIYIDIYIYIVFFIFIYIYIYIHLSYHHSFVNVEPRAWIELFFGFSKVKMELLQSPKQKDLQMLKTTRPQASLGSAWVEHGNTSDVKMWCFCMFTDIFEDGELLLP